MTYKIELTKEQLVILGEALAAMPYGRVRDFINELTTQVAAQEKQKQEQERGQ